MLQIENEKAIKTEKSPFSLALKTRNFFFNFLVSQNKKSEKAPGIFFLSEKDDGLTFIIKILLHVARHERSKDRWSERNKPEKNKMK